MTAPALDWRLVSEEARPGPMQMALDEAAAETAAAGGPATIRTYRWDPSCLTLGYRQDPATVDWRFCDREGIDVTRRQTGGGGIYHDNRGDIAYSIAVPAADVPGKLLDCYHLLCEPILDAFARLGIDADYVGESVPELYHPACYLRELHPAHDVVAGVGSDGSGASGGSGGSGASGGSGGDGGSGGSGGSGASGGSGGSGGSGASGGSGGSGGSDGGNESAGRGRKIAGNAQYRKRDAVIQHGSLTFSVDAERHLGVFADPPVTAEAFRDRVVGIDELTDVDRSTAVTAVEEALVAWVAESDGAELDRDGSWTERELERADELVETKYRDDDWIRSRPGESGR